MSTVALRHYGGVSVYTSHRRLPLNTLLLGSVGVPAPIIRHLWYTNWEYMPGKEAAGLYIVHRSPGSLHRIYLLQYRVRYSIQQYTEKKDYIKKYADCAVLH